MKQLIRVATVIALLSLLLPVGAGAQANNARQEAFCSQQSERQTKVLDKFTNRIEKYSDAKRTQTQNQSARRNGRDEAVASARTEADFRRAESFSILASKQDTEERIRKVKQFALEVKVAVDGRRAAYDEARIVYQDTIDRLLSERTGAMDKVISIFQDKTRLALESATGQCSNNPTERAEIRQLMIADLKQARAKFNEELRNRPDYKQAVGQAIKARREAFRVATRTFEQAMQQIQTKYTDLKD